MHTPNQFMDVVKLDKQAIHPLRRDRNMIFQTRFPSLNPRWTLLEIVGEPLLVNGIAKGKQIEEQVADAAPAVGPAPGIHAALPACLQRRRTPAHWHRPRPGHPPQAGDRR